MHRSLAVLAILSAIILLVSAGNVRHNAIAAPARAHHHPGIHGVAEPIHNEYIVTLQHVDPARVHKIAVRLAHKHNGTIIDIYTHALLGFAVKMTEPHALALSREPLVASVYQDGKAHETATETAPSWGLDRIDQRSLPLNNTYSYSGTGAKVHIYIEDSGILYTHEDFGGRAKLGIDTVGDGQKGNDCDGHGTMVAGIAAGKKYGVAKSAALISVRVFDCRGWTDWSDILKGIDWITANAKKPAVANLSLGGGPNAVVDAAIEKSIASGVTYVVAAGNDNRDACKGTPERIPAVLSVAAVDKTDKRASSSQWGTCVDLFAPGVAVDSDGIGSNTATRLGGGTSAASPFVAGSAAVYLGEHPTATPAQVMAAIVGSATPNVVKDPGTGTPNKLLFTG